ncbi:Transcriptional regulator NRG1 [Taphrina deformans PYCC 5710]|uniref:Transcriptional regulator NRG1 n=1 Tax=Taphrina deformans (strain PYCC 5710 / ATCC 11124 / CBS 356.35 / IMI 108563 / JCM 9778 / NBRC 8474) TaxID=1097556 RepID=R4XA21_TAPDE|nr:Transcriptional regulator NRG1 [Taphrina deformans PYCC 5710]|eukprot:CCG82633.1 Transcriptional regulator NRG1 [Taphrina deformans PYCC 5710]
MDDPVSIIGEEDTLDFYGFTDMKPPTMPNVKDAAAATETLEMISTTKAKKLHPHHGTNASSDAAGLPSKPKKYHCCFAQCGKEFSTSGHLARHYRIHTGEKNYACSKCGARFSRQDNCNQHAKSHTKADVKAPVKDNKEPMKLPMKSPLSIASTESLLESDRPRPVHTTSYAGSHIAFSEADYASSSNGFLNDLELSPDFQARYEFGTPHALSKLPESLFDMLARPETCPPNLVYDSSVAETDESTYSFNNNDFISEEDFFNWSAGITYPEGEDGIEVPLDI